MHLVRKKRIDDCGDFYLNCMKLLEMSSRKPMDLRETFCTGHPAVLLRRHENLVLNAASVPVFYRGFHALGISSCWLPFSFFHPVMYVSLVERNVSSNMIFTCFRELR